MSNKEKNDVHDARQIIFGIIIPKHKRASKTNTAKLISFISIENKENSRKKNLFNRNEGDESNLLAFVSLFLPSDTICFQSSFLLLLRHFLLLPTKERSILENAAASDAFVTQPFLLISKMN